MNRNLTNPNYDEGQVLDMLGRRGIDPSEVALIAEVGSTVHGLGVGGQDDLDLTVIRFEDWSEFVNGPSKRQSMMIRTQPDGVRSGPGDIDLQVYTFRKFAELALKLNPSILNVFFLPESALFRVTEAFAWDADRIAPKLASKEAGRRYLGYMKAQLERWRGLRGQKNVNRPELVEAYGFDTKYAAHIVRLGLQGTEYLLEGSITIPMEPQVAREIRALRTGGFSEAQALQWADDVEAELRVAMEVSPFPMKPDVSGVRRVVAEAYFSEFVRD